MSGLWYHGHCWPLIRSLQLFCSFWGDRTMVDKDLWHQLHNHLWISTCFKLYNPKFLYRSSNYIIKTNGILKKKIESVKMHRVRKIKPIILWCEVNTWCSNSFMELFLTLCIDPTQQGSPSWPNKYHFCMLFCNISQWTHSIKWLIS